VFDPNNETTIYIQIYDPKGALIISPILFSAAQMIDSVSSRHAFYAFLMSGLLVLAAYNFLYYLHLRDTAFLTLSVFITALAMEMGDSSGLLHFFPWIPNYLGWVGASFAFIVMISGHHLAISLFDIRQQLPEMVFWYQLGSISALILMIVSLFFGYGLLLASIVGAYGIFIVSITFLKFHKQQYTLPKSLTFSITIFLTAGLPLLLTVMGVIEHYPPTTDWFFIATLISLLILSLTQAEKIRLKGEFLERTAATNKAKDEFLTTMSHELRTPMNAVVGAGRLLDLTSLSKDQKEYVSRLNHSSSHMLALVNDLLDLARVDHQLLQLEKVPFKLDEILNTLKQLLKESASKQQLELSLENHFFPFNKHPVGDPTRLNQVLLNVLGNAIKFTHSGKVSLSITPIEIKPNIARLRFEVNDTGIGLTKDQQTNLFLPFSQAESSTSREYGGSGLGLAISQKLVKRMGGELKVRSVHKQGSSFSFDLSFPLKSNNTKANVNEPALPTSLQGYKILLVDDDEMNRFFGKKLLEVCEVDVSIADSGETAIQLIKEETFDLVFMDISMPNVDGYETTRRIRLLTEVDNLVIIALTAHAIAGERERCITAGMNDYLTKPFELDDLQKMMTKWLSKTQKNVRIS
jgi:signal transduction histidine kinase/ActR/RegA family two-component response regulator